MRFHGLSVTYIQPGQTSCGMKWPQDMMWPLYATCTPRDAPVFCCTNPRRAVQEAHLDRSTRAAERGSVSRSADDEDEAARMGRRRVNKRGCCGSPSRGPLVRPRWSLLQGRKTDLLLPG